MLKIALVHDDFIQWGGAERLVAALGEFWPQAPIYTSMVTDSVVSKTGIDPSRFRTSFLDRLPWKEKLNKPLFPLYPIAFESFDFSDFDLVISSSTRFAHGVITKPGTRHIAYINSPFRGFWEPDLYFGSDVRGRVTKYALSPWLSYMRGWDFVAGQRPDTIIANSQTSANRVQKYYRRSAKIIYPFADFARFEQEEKPNFNIPDEFFIMISRLVSWKQFDIVIEAFNQMNKNLIVIGNGPDKQRLTNMAGSTVQIPTKFVTDSQVTYLLKRAVALIHPQKEDFGMTVIEANACGTPTVAYRQGGALETVIENKTGVFFDTQDCQSVIQVVKDLNQDQFDQNVLSVHAQNFSKESFLEKWHQFSREPESPS